MVTLRGLHDTKAPPQKKKRWFSGVNVEACIINEFPLKTIHKLNDFFFTNFNMPTCIKIMPSVDHISGTMLLEKKKLLLPEEAQVQKLIGIFHSWE